MEIEAAKVPKRTGAPGRMSWVVAAPARTSAKIWVSVPATVTGLIAPDKMKGETTEAWLWRA
ncbi:hypothetical protein D3C79_1049350 [compost metagenome]